MESSNDYNFNGQYVHKKFDRKKRLFTEMLSSNYKATNSPLNLSINNSLSTSPNSTSSYEKRLSVDEKISISSRDEVTSVSSNDQDDKPPPSKQQKIMHSIKENDAINLLRLPKQTLLKICQYHPNMARHGTKVERTPRDQDRRNKNTIACRKTRRVKKLQEVAAHEDYKNCHKKYFELVREKMRCQYYVSHLMKLLEENNLKLDPGDKLDGSISDLESVN